VGIRETKHEHATLCRKPKRLDKFPQFQQYDFREIHPVTFCAETKASKAADNEKRQVRDVKLRKPRKN
jgi:hypothetical protein